MSGLTFATVHGDDFKSLTEAARRLRASGDEFDAAADQVRAHGKTVPGMWEGVDADAATKVLTDQARPLEDAGQVFRKASRIIDHLGTRLNGHHERLQDLAAAALRVPADVDMESGKVTPKPIVGATFNSAADVAAFNREKKEREYWANWYDTQIAQTVRKARDDDDTAKGELDGIDQYKESENAYSGQFGQDADREDADEATRLFHKASNGKLTKAELTRLRELLNENRIDREFAGQVLKTLGAKGFLNAYGSVAQEKGGLTAAFQRDMASLLATATTPDGAPHQNNPWTREFIQLIRDGATYQSAHGREEQIAAVALLAPLLQQDGFDSSFKAAVSGEIFNRFADTGNPLARGYLGPDFNALNATYSKFPESAVLEGLARDPKASEYFFAVGLNSKNDRVKFVLDNTAGKGRTAPAGSVLFDPKVVGLALEGATTGYDGFDPYGPKTEEAHVGVGPHTGFRSDIARRVADVVGGNPTPFQVNTKDAHQFRRSVANIATSYAVDVHNAFLDKSDSKFAKDYKLATNGTDAGFGSIDEDNFKQFIELIGHDAESREQLYAASNVLAREELARAVKLHPGDTAQKQEALEPHFRVLGLLHSGRLEFEFWNPAQGSELAEAFDDNKRAEAARTGVKVLAGSALGVATAYALPVTGIAAVSAVSVGSSVAGELSGKGIDNATKGWTTDVQKIFEAQEKAAVEQYTPNLVAEYDSINQFVRDRGFEVDNEDTDNGAARQNLIEDNFGKFVDPHDRGELPNDTGEEE